MIKMTTKGVKVKTRFTRAYSGILVRDDGWHELSNRLSKRYDVFFLDDVPPVAKSKNVCYNGVKGKILVGYKSIEFSALFSNCDKVWYFFDKDGNRIDIIKEIKRCKK